MTATWPIRLTSSCWRSSSIGRYSTGPPTPTPALLTSAGQRPARRPRARGLDLGGVGDVELQRRDPAPAQALGVLVLAHAGEHLEAQLLEMRRGGLADAGRGPVTTTLPRPVAFMALNLSGSVEGWWKWKPRSERAAPTRPTAPSPWTGRRSDELFELARWAPNHNLTNPWRFRVLGPEALARLKERPGRRPRPSSTARRRWWSRAWSRAATRCRTRRTSAPARWPPTSCCWPRTRAGWSATGARPRCCAARGARRGRHGGRRARARPAPPRSAPAGEGPAAAPGP